MSLRFQCNVVFHTASPFWTKVLDPQRDLVDPAVAGTKNVMMAARDAKSVTRVVLTSSVAVTFSFFLAPFTLRCHSLVDSWIHRWALATGCDPAGAETGGALEDLHRG